MMGYSRRKGPYALYRMWADDGRLLYIGCSYSPMTRMSEHERMQPWATDISKITVTWLPDFASASEAERMAIAAESPIWNVQHSATKTRKIGIHNPRFDRSDRSTWVSQAKAS